jgi:hypothetical protein
MITTFSTTRSNLLSIIRRDTRNPAMLFLAARSGYALFQNGNVLRFLVQKSSDGNGTVTRINRFPPPPTIQ